MHTVNQVSKSISHFNGLTNSFAITGSNSANPEMILLGRCKKGDMQAWDTLVHMHEETVFRFAFMLCKDRDAAADISGRVFVWLYQNLHAYRNDMCFVSWLIRNVRYVYLNVVIAS